MMRPKIYLFGDSITEFSFTHAAWGSSLANHFSRTADIVVRGYSGYNTRWAVNVLDRVFPEQDGETPPVAVTVFFGANDACLPDRHLSFLHVPLEEYKKNLQSIYSFLKKRWQSANIIFITPPPIDEAARLRDSSDNTSGLPERTNEAASAYAKACIDVATECGAAVVDIWTKMQELPDWKNSCLSDGLHLALSGNRIVFEEVVAKLKEAGLCLEKLPADLPLFSDIDPNDPLKAFEN